MSMTKMIEIDEREVAFRTSAAIPRNLPVEVPEGYL